jgi:nicotinamidase-related amidase
LRCISQGTRLMAAHASPDMRIGGDSTPLKRSPTALLLVDFINPLRFPGGRDLSRPALRAARVAATLQQELRSRRVQSIYANDNYGVWRSSFADVVQRCESQGGAAASITRLLVPKDDDIAVLKPRQSAFFATPLELLLEQLKTRRLIVVGLATDLCVLFTALDAHVRGYELWVPRDCVAAESASRQRAALGYLEGVLQVDTRAAMA